MASKSTKNQQQNLDLVNLYIAPLLDPIKKATGIGTWTGYDGAAQFLNGPRIEGLKKLGDGAYNLGLQNCFSAISETTLVKKDTTVLKKFAEEHMDFIILLSKKNPSLFIDNQGMLERTCKSVMDEDSRKEFEKNLKKYIKDMDSGKGYNHPVKDLSR